MTTLVAPSDMGRLADLLESGMDPDEAVALVNEERRERVRRGE